MQVSCLLASWACTLHPHALPISSHVSSSFPPLSFCHHCFWFRLFTCLLSPISTIVAYFCLLVLACLLSLVFAIIAYSHMPIPTCFHNCRCSYLLAFAIVLCSHLLAITCFCHLLPSPPTYFRLFVFAIMYLVYFHLFRRMNTYFVVCLFEFQICAPCLILPPFSICAGSGTQEAS